MWSKDWKLLVIAPLSAVFLTACPDTSKKRYDEQLQSQYSGIWIGSELDDLYRKHGQNDNAFCDELWWDPARFGVSLDLLNPWRSRQRVIVDAWLVTARGEVIVFIPTSRTEEAAYRQTYHIGSIDRAGFFNEKNRMSYYGAGAVQGTYAYGQNQFLKETAIVNRSGETLSVSTSSNIRNYKLLTETDRNRAWVTNIYTTVNRCFRNNSARDFFERNIVPNHGVTVEEYFRRGGRRTIYGGAGGATVGGGGALVDPYAQGGAMPPPGVDPSAPMKPSEVK